MLRVPGIGTMNGFCASSQARAIWAGVAFFASAHPVRRSTNGWLAAGSQALKRGNGSRRSVFGVEPGAGSILPVR